MPVEQKKRMNRKLIRPNLSEYKDKASREQTKKKSHPPYETHAENYYYLKQMNKKILMTVEFLDGETIHGYVEWYDRDCFKLNRDDLPNLLIYKRNIKYMYKIDPPAKNTTAKSSKKDSSSSAQKKG